MAWVWVVSFGHFVHCYPAETITKGFVGWRFGLDILSIRKIATFTTARWRVCDGQRSVFTAACLQ